MLTALSYEIYIMHTYATCIYPLNNLYTFSAQPIHWVYKDEDLAKAVEGINPEFLPKSINSFYRQTTGQQSPYGDLLIVMLESLAACKGISHIIILLSIGRDILMWDLMPYGEGKQTKCKAESAKLGEEVA